MTWQWNGRDLTEDDAEKYYGFVYCITNRGTAQKYIGKKFFWFKKTLKPTLAVRVNI